MPNYLIFRLYGSLASWGDMAVGGVRPSHRYPTKSAVLGLIAAALGIRREEEEKLQILQDEVCFGVRIDCPGTLIIDYHTAQVPSKSSLKNRSHITRRDELLVPELNTILSTREYYCDAVYTVVLWSWRELSRFSFSEISHALRYPAFTLYMGRKSCPMSLPIISMSISAEGIEQALEIADKEMKGSEGDILGFLLQKHVGSKPLFWENGQGTLLESASYQDRRIRKDKLKNRSRWQYQDREELYKLLPDSSENNNVF